LFSSRMLYLVESLDLRDEKVLAIRCGHC
jgi:hypothetical protein